MYVFRGPVRRQNDDSSSGLRVGGVAPGVGSPLLQIVWAPGGRVFELGGRVICQTKAIDEAFMPVYRRSRSDQRRGRTSPP